MVSEHSPGPDVVASATKINLKASLTQVGESTVTKWHCEIPFKFLQVLVKIWTEPVGALGAEGVAELVAGGVRVLSRTAGKQWLTQNSKRTQVWPSLRQRQGRGGGVREWTSLRLMLRKNVSEQGSPKDSLTWTLGTMWNHMKTLARPQLPGLPLGLPETHFWAQFTPEQRTG